MTHLSLEPGERQRVHVELFFPAGGAIAAAARLHLPGARRTQPPTDGHQPFLPRFSPTPISGRGHAALPSLLRLPLTVAFYHPVYLSLPCPRYTAVPSFDRPKKSVFSVPDEPSEASPISRLELLGLPSSPTARPSIGFLAAKVRVCLLVRLSGPPHPSESLVCLEALPPLPHFLRGFLPTAIPKASANQEARKLVILIFRDSRDCHFFYMKIEGIILGDWKSTQGIHLLCVLISIVSRRTEADDDRGDQRRGP